MRVVRHTDGSYSVDAGLLGSAFRIEPAAVSDLMRSGAITGHHEKGVGADAGRHCLSFSHLGLTLRIVFNEAGEILSQSVFRPIIARGAKVKRPDDPRSAPLFTVRTSTGRP